MNKLIAILHKILLSKKAAALFTFIFVLFLAAVVAFGALPAKVYLDAARARASDAIANIVPQAWGFFTKNPREPIYKAYRFVEGDWIPENRGPNSSVTSSFGWNRSSRLGEYDIQLIGVEDYKFHECSMNSSDYECIKDANNLINEERVVVYADSAKLCGKVAILKQELVPLAYARLEYSPTREVYIANVDCNNVDEK